MARFEKISKENFYKHYDPNKFKWDDLKLPKRATVASAGYDFYMPFEADLQPNETLMVPTGICVSLDAFTFLMLVPRSGLGAKKRLRLNNDVGIIDPDYYHSSNGGHIMAYITNEGNENIHLEKGQAFMQGIIVPFTITCDDDTTAKRDGGFGSTDRSVE